jgi:hypothetical protein
MTENSSNLNIEIVGQESLPQISAEGVAYYKRFLADEQWCAGNRATADMLREALAATGQDREPPPDERSAAQRLHDQRLGVEPRTAEQYSDVPDAYRQFCAELLLPQHLARVIVDDALSSGEKADARQRCWGTSTLTC